MSLKKIVYKLWDIMTLGKGVERTISGFTLRLPVRYSRYFPQNYERDNFDLLSEHCSKGSVVIDIGAHIGLFAVRAAQLIKEGGRVYAFEPAPKTNALLLKTIQINGMENIIEPRNEAIAEKDGVTHFNASDTEGDNSNSLVEYRKDRHLNKIEVRIVSVDNFIRSKNLSKVNFIKIDAEGYEYNVLKGAEQTFKKFLPKAILALHPKAIQANGDSLEEIYDFLFNARYNIFYGNHIISRSEFCDRDQLFDVHLIPKEQ
jgi:FkbM family methyltransferase